MQVSESTLLGRLVRLEPLRPAHTEDLAQAGAHDAIWTYLDEPTPHTTAAMANLVRDALDEQARGERLPFAVISVSTERAIGSISFIDLQPAHRGLEVGWGWITPAEWGTGTMREAVMLLLGYAFDSLGAIRVAFKTDSRNLRSQGALRAIGAQREGCFRHHRILRDGHVRDSVYYSITDEDWVAVRSRTST